MPSSARRTYYMHTLDGKPAQFVGMHGDAYIAFAGGRGLPAPLAASLQQIRREQRIAIANAKSPMGCGTAWADPKRYGYVRVEVPDAE